MDEKSVSEAATRFLGWLSTEVMTSARGDRDTELTVQPSGRFWLGRLASEEAVDDLGFGDRGERLSPCAIGIRLLPTEPGPWSFTATVAMCCWLKQDKTFRKAPKVEVSVAVRAEPGIEEQAFGTKEIETALATATGLVGYVAEVRVEISHDATGCIELTVLLVNTTPTDAPGFGDRNIYECSLTLSNLPHRPYTLEALPDAFRYDRNVEAYGINCGVVADAESLQTSDAPTAEQARPTYWSGPGAEPDLTFRSLAKSPLPPLQQLVESHRAWGAEEWSQKTLEVRAVAEQWSPAMRAAAAASSDAFRDEAMRLTAGLDLLSNNNRLQEAFRLMNRAMERSAAGKYDRWRPFQIGFLLANLVSITSTTDDAGIADVVWFATGGGKTETYLGLIVTAAFYERLDGRVAGVTAWSRFPLRMLSLQQTQRVTNAMAAAETIRREAAIGGDPFSVGFLVGGSSTPNKIARDPRGDDADPDDDDMPKRYKILEVCPFCRRNTIEMRFDRLTWALQHHCSNPNCSWSDDALPFYIVDQEIFRFLPTVVIGTLDKAASIALQGALRGIIAAPVAKCTVAGHGYTYVARSERPNGCLVPGCRGERMPLEMPEERYAPTFRLQDELHLLRDSLGAVDAHYESMLDSLEMAITGRYAKILASSATLSGYQRQVNVLYGRAARVFPSPGPRARTSFWSRDTSDLSRRFIALAPRGVTIEYALDRLITDTQAAVRRLLNHPDETCVAIGVSLDAAPVLVSLYGTNVIYGNTLRDLDAAMRSVESQILVDGPVNAAPLTGRSAFDEVRQTLARLENPEEAFEDRLHVIAASAMMSHGVDVDRLNIMAMLGLPLTTSEFIQATARVGRRWPGIVFVLHKIGRERDASVYRSFGSYVTQSDRFVEPIAITRRSRRVLERTLPGLMLARILQLHEPKAGRSLYRASQIRNYFAAAGVTEEIERDALIACLGISSTLDAPLREDVTTWVARFFRNLNDPSGTYETAADLCGGLKPMQSLRDVEEQAPVYGAVER